MTIYGDAQSLATCWWQRAAAEHARGRPERAQIYEQCARDLQRLTTRAPDEGPFLMPHPDPT